RSMSVSSECVAWRLFFRRALYQAVRGLGSSLSPRAGRGLGSCTQQQRAGMANRPTALAFASEAGLEAEALSSISQGGPMARATIRPGRSFNWRHCVAFAVGAA